MSHCAGELAIARGESEWMDGWEVNFVMRISEARRKQNGNPKKKKIDEYHPDVRRIGFLSISHSTTDHGIDFRISVSVSIDIDIVTW